MHLVAKDEKTRDQWVNGLRYLTDDHKKKRQRHVINETKSDYKKKHFRLTKHFECFSWIMNYFYLADRDNSNQLSKQECKKLLVNILNANVSAKEFDQLFQVLTLS